MSRKSKVLITVITLLMAFSLLGCNLISQGLSRLFATSTPTSTDTPTVTPTSTSTPTPTATPLPPVGLYACPAQSDCPDVAKLLSFYDGTIEPGIQAYVEFPYNIPVRIEAGWVTVDQATLDANLQHINFFLKIDGINYVDPSMFGYGVELDDQGNPTTNPGYYMGFVLSGWKLGESHTIQYGYTIDSEINDGWQDYQPQMVEFQILAEPVDIPTATSTPLPTWTPKPIIYTPRPTKIPATPVSACDAEAQIEISNTTDGTVTMYLSGPAKYTFYVPVGDTNYNVCGGQYSYTAYGCGGASLNGTISSGESHQFYCSSN